MDCTFIAAPNFSQMIFCTLLTLGITFDIFALAILLIFTMFAFYFKTDLNASLGIGFIISYSLLVWSGNSSYMLQVIVGLLIIGIALRIFTGFMSATNR